MFLNGQKAEGCLKINFRLLVEELSEYYSIGGLRMRYK